MIPWSCGKIIEERLGRQVQGHFRNSAARFRRWVLLWSWRSWNNENTGKNGTQIRVTVEELWPIEVEEKSNGIEEKGSQTREFSRTTHRTGSYPKPVRGTCEPVRGVWYANLILFPDWSKEFHMFTTLSKTHLDEFCSARKGSSS